MVQRSPLLPVWRAASIDFRLALRSPVLPTGEIAAQIDGFEASSAGGAS